jgi:hypothetical protein
MNSRIHQTRAPGGLAGSGHRWASREILVRLGAARTIQAIVQGHQEVLADERTRQVKAALPHDLDVLYEPLQ